MSNALMPKRWAQVTALGFLSLVGCGSTQLVIERTVVNGTTGTAVMEGNTVRGIEESELLVAFGGANGKGEGVARARVPAVLEVVFAAQLEDREDENEVRQEKRDRCQGELPPQISVSKTVSPDTIEMEEGSGVAPVEYSLVISNTGGTPIDRLTLVDALPRGFHVTSVEAKDFARTPGEIVAVTLTFYLVYPLVEFFSRDSAMTDFSHMAYETISSDGRDHLVIKLEMKEEPLSCTGNEHYVVLKVQGNLDIPGKGQAE